MANSTTSKLLCRPVLRGDYDDDDDYDDDYDDDDRAPSAGTVTTRCAVETNDMSQNN